MVEILNHSLSTKGKTQEGDPKSMHLWRKNSFIKNQHVIRDSLLSPVDASWQAEINVSYWKAPQKANSFEKWIFRCRSRILSFFQLGHFWSTHLAYLIKDVIVNLIPDCMQSGNILEISSCLGNVSVCSSAHLCTKMAAFSPQFTEKFTKLKLSKNKTSCAIAMHTNE